MTFNLLIQQPFLQPQAITLLESGAFNNAVSLTSAIFSSYKGVCILTYMPFYVFFLLCKVSNELYST